MFWNPEASGNPPLPPQPPPPPFQQPYQQHFGATKKPRYDNNSGLFQGHSYNNQRSGHRGSGGRNDGRGGGGRGAWRGAGGKGSRGRGNHYSKKSLFRPSMVEDPWASFNSSTPSSTFSSMGFDPSIYGGERQPEMGGNGGVDFSMQIALWAPYTLPTSSSSSSSSSTSNQQAPTEYLPSLLDSQKRSEIFVPPLPRGPPPSVPPPPPGPPPTYQTTQGDVTAAHHQEFEPIFLETVDTIETLLKLGLDHLKNDLKRRGLKMGGTLQERAERLWAIKGLSDDQIDPKLKRTC